MPDDPIKFDAPAKRPYRIGTVQTIDMETGEVLGERPTAFQLKPPPPDVCQACGVDHPLDTPHNQQSLYYQYAFHATHGRWPTWSDAMAHCAPEVRALWTKALIAELEKHGLEIPADLTSPGVPPAPGR